MTKAMQIREWQQCRHTSPLLCSMDPDHPPLAWVSKMNGTGYLQCMECEFIRYDINPQILKMVHRPRHHGCYLP